MIGIRKPAAPVVLATNGIAAATAHCAEYDQNPASYRQGLAHFTFNKPSMLTTT